jgi:DNA-directed RNA polymerase subunit RPC12/RpoP
MKYRCRVCGKLFVDEESVINHILTHESITDYVDGLLNKYYTAVRNNELTYYKCEICGKQYIILSTLRIHLTKHEEIRQLINNKIREYYDIVKRSRFPLVRPKKHLEENRGLKQEYLEHLKTIMGFITALTAITVLTFLPLLISVVLRYLFKNDVIVYIGLALEFLWVPLLLSLSER